MVAKEGSPTLARPSGALDHVFGDGRFGDLDAELEQLAVDSRRTPQPVGPAHFPDQVADLSGDHRAASSGPGLPTPEGSEPAPMPADQRLRSDNRNGNNCGGAKPIEPDEQKPIRVGQPHAPRHFAPQDVQLMAQQQDLDLKPPSRLDQRNQPTP